MPATAIDDRTFFILYALTKKPDLQISKLYSFYEECSFENIVKNLDILENFEIEILYKIKKDEQFASYLFL